MGGAVNRRARAGQGLIAPCTRAGCTLERPPIRTTREPQTADFFRMTDRTNTIFGWILFAGVVALMLKFLTGLVIPDTHRPENLGYVIEGVEEEGGDEGPALATLLASGDAAAGEAVFAKCAACHTIASGGANGIGPNLYGVLGKPIGSHVPGFDYSSALAGHGGVWDYENMDAWLASPRGFANGTKMSFAGLGKPEDRANVILYLRENGGGPALPEAEAEVSEEAGTEAESIDDSGDPGVTASEGMSADVEVAGSNAATGNAGQE